MSQSFFAYTAKCRIKVQPIGQQKKQFLALFFYLNCILAVLSNTQLLLFSKLAECEAQQVKWFLTVELLHHAWLGRPNAPSGR